MSCDISQLFSITRAANACGVSRSTILRMEERGLLTPAYTAPNSGRRYYDNHNIARILQIQYFQSMGFNTKQIAAYFAQGGDATELLTVLKTKLKMLQRSVEELSLRTMPTPDTSVQIMELPETTCCVRKCLNTNPTPQAKYDAMYSYYHECINNGYILDTEPLFVINERTDYLEGQLSEAPYTFYVCVPVLAKKAPAHAVHFPSCTVLSALSYGNYATPNETLLRLGRETKERGLTPAGFLRAIGIVAPYTGQEINPKRYCTRYALPIKL